MSSMEDLPKPMKRNVVCMAPDIAAVVVDVGRDLSGREGRFLGVELRTQQALLLGADEGKQDVDRLGASGRASSAFPDRQNLRNP